MSTSLIKTLIVEELEKENPKAAKKLKNRKFWELKSLNCAVPIIGLISSRFAVILQGVSKIERGR